MALGRGEDLNVRLTADNKASKEIRQVADELDALEKANPEIKVGADTKAATRSIDDVLAKVDKLAGTDAANLILTSNATAIGTDIADLILELDKLDAKDPRVDVIAGDIRALEGDLGRIAAKARELDGLDARVDVSADAEDALGDIDRAGDALRALDGDTAKVNIDAEGIDGLLSKLDALPGKFGELGGSLSGIASSVGTAGPIALGIAGMATGLLAAADYAANAATNVKVVGDLLDLDVERASRLSAVWQQAGYDLNDLQDVALQLNGVLAESPELAAQIGINLEDGKSAGERFVEVVGLVQDGLVDVTTQSKLFGEEGVRQVSGMITRVGDLNAAMENLPEGAVFDDADVEAALEMQRSVADMKAEMQAMALELGGLVIQAWDFAEAIGRGADRVASWVNPFDDDDVTGRTVDQFINLIGLTDDLRAKLEDLPSVDGQVFDLDSAGGLAGYAEALQGVGVEATFANGALIVNGEVLKSIPWVSSAADIAAYNEALGRSGPAVEASLEAARGAEAQHRRHFAALEDTSAASERLAEATAGAEEQHRRHFAALEDTSGALEGARAALEAVAEDTDVAALALEGMTSALGTAELREGALQRVFALGNAPLDAAASIRDITLGIEGLSEVADGLDLSAGLDVSNVDLDPLLDAIDGLRPGIQQAIGDAFQVGGAEGARATAQAYIDNIYNELGGRVSKEDIAAALGIDGGVDAFVNVLVEQAEIDKARRMLETLVGLNGGTPLTAAVQLALDAGTITAEQAQILILDALGDAGVPLPVGIVPPTQAEVDAALAALTGQPATIPVDADTTQAEADADEARQLAEAQATMPVDADTAQARADADEARQLAEAQATMPVDGDTGPLLDDAASARSNIANNPATMRVRGNYTGTDNIPSNITIRVRGLLAPLAVAAGGIFKDGVQRFANGGHRLRDAMIQRAVGPAGLFQWAEPETGGESFIPHAPSKRRRSLEIWRRTGQILGALPMSDGGMVVGGGSTTTTNGAATVYQFHTTIEGSVYGVDDLERRLERRDRELAQRIRVAR